ncbi:MAG: trypsin-like peptidase domain-containing protein [Armatimonadetes bacterium]|nr:trypsin-like peptidase domain-containing protein [Armatimonadota bacterium]
MKKLIGIFAACLVGTLAALQVNQYIQDRKTGRMFEPSAVQGKYASAEIAGAAPPDFRAAARKILDSVVSIDTAGTVRRGFFQSYTGPIGKGSGVVLSSDGYIVTNNHVVINPSTGDTAEAIRVHLGNGKVYTAQLKGRDPRSDLAVLKVDATNLVPAEIGSSKSLEVGEWVMAAGNPLGFDQTLSVGVVSSLNREVDLTNGGQNPEGMYLIGAIQTDAAINPGNSGGALADAGGKLIGINSAIASQTGQSAGIGFAIPVERVRQISKDIIESGRARYGVLGVQTYSYPGVLDIAEARAQILNEVGAEPPRNGILVQSVSPGSPASIAGLKSLSVIQKIGSIDIKNQMDFQRALADKRPGDKLSITFWTAGKTATATVTLADLANL